MSLLEFEAKVLRYHSGTEVMDEAGKDDGFWLLLERIQNDVKYSAWVEVKNPIKDFISLACTSIPC